jgi:hypothetical protein
MMRKATMVMFAPNSIILRIKLDRKFISQEQINEIKEKHLKEIELKNCEIEEVTFSKGFCSMCKEQIIFSKKVKNSEKKAKLIEFLNKPDSQWHEIADLWTCEGVTYDHLHPSQISCPPNR